ncbi:4'-phosphopantetheinyl transferase family protein [Blattabacterium cuenoti]|uniref:4'-phosphopantetheinyl transferase family protein n=1 Tax=Blattabacterium cuenoti TaxID=1653831 RepID=UPI00163C0011|nr:4'-phosphopantetheinyl transferase superfamily protein [Blattabacterium cuenoti]
MKNTKFDEIHTKIIVIKWNKYLNTTNFKQLLLLNDKERKIFLSLSDKRKIEFIGTRFILRYMRIKINSLYNNNFFIYKGKKKYFSLSHSYERIAIAISSYHVGIDIEKYREKITKIKKKFVRKDENFFLKKKSEKDYLHIIWGIKESLYKLNGGTYYNFLNHYKVSPFCIKKDHSIQCWIIKKYCSKKFTAFYKKLENYYLVYSIDI